MAKVTVCCYIVAMLPCHVAMLYCQHGKCCEIAWCINKESSSFRAICNL